MAYTFDDLLRDGYCIQAAPVNAWRHYDEGDPMPGYFQFDWLSARHPDLYHRFALTTVGLMDRLHRIVDLSGLELVDLGAGTGRATIEAARKARRVIAVDRFEAVIPYGRERIAQAGLTNVTYIRADNDHLPLADNCLDASICAWAVWNRQEAYRVLKPDGYMIELGPAPGSLCGELTATLAQVYPEIITEIAEASVYRPDFRDFYSVIDDGSWDGIPLSHPTRVLDFTYLSDYGDPGEAVAILGRLYGPAARQYILERQQASLAWRLRIIVNRVKKF